MQTMTEIHGALGGRWDEQPGEDAGNRTDHQKHTFVRPSVLLRALTAPL